MRTNKLPYGTMVISAGTSEGVYYAKKNIKIDGVEVRKGGRAHSGHVRFTLTNGQVVELNSDSIINAKRGLIYRLAMMQQSLYDAQQKSSQPLDKDQQALMEELGQLVDKHELNGFNAHPLSLDAQLK